MQVSVSYPDKPATFDLGCTQAAVKVYIGYKCYLERRVHERVIPLLADIFAMAIQVPAQRKNAMLMTIAISELRLRQETDPYRQFYLFEAVGGLVTMLGLSVPAEWNQRRAAVCRRLERLNFDPQQAHRAGLAVCELGNAPGRAQELKSAASTAGHGKVEQAPLPPNGE